MKPLQLDTIARVVNGILIPREASNVFIHGVSHDTRELSPGELYIALKGERYDGHDFVEHAVTQKAIGAIVSKDFNTSLDYPFPLIKVDDTLKALGDLALFYRSKFTPKVIGITGSVGKTTTRMLIYEVLKTKFKVVQPEKNYNNLIGLPLTLFNIEPSTELVLLELAINQPGEMARLVKIAHPDYGVMTTIGPSHLEGLKSIDNVLREKSKLIKRAKIGLLNIDDPNIASSSLIKSNNTIITYGLKNTTADFHASDISFDPDGCPTFKINNSQNISITIAGKAIIYSALAAFALGTQFKIPQDTMVEIISSFHAPALRMEILEKNNTRIIKDCYNANPLSMKEAINTLCLMQAGKRTTILGDMLELGADAVNLHKEIGAFIAASCVDQLFTYGDMGKYISESAVQAGMSGENVVHLASKKDIEQFKDAILSSDIILVKGSHGMKMEEFIELL